MRTRAPKRVLHIVSAMNRGGTETLLMNLYRNLDKERVQFDFVSHRKEKCAFDDEIEAMGGNVYRISSLGQVGPIAYIRELKKIMRSTPYIAVHSHTDFQSGFPALAAKLVGINKRICHSHSNQWTKNNGLKERLILAVFQKIITFSATDYCACSQEAASFLFGKKKVNQGKIHILNNGIEVERFTQLIENSVESVRKELSIPENSVIIGHVGHLSYIKNQGFILKILKQMLNERKNIYAVFVGDGPLRSSIEEDAAELGLCNNIRILGVRDDISRMMKAFDVFVFPSLSEGFGIVTLEAQCAGTPCVVSDGVPRTTDLGLGLIKYLSLDDDLRNWSEEIMKALTIKKPDNYAIAESFQKMGFSIRENTNKWLTLYGIQSSLARS